MKLRALLLMTVMLTGCEKAKADPSPIKSSTLVMAGDSSVATIYFRNVPGATQYRVRFIVGTDTITQTVASTIKSASQKLAGPPPLGTLTVRMCVAARGQTTYYPEACTVKSVTRPETPLPAPVIDSATVELTIQRLYDGLPRPIQPVLVAVARTAGSTDTVRCPGLWHADTNRAIRILPRGQANSTLECRRIIALLPLNRRALTLDSLQRVRPDSVLRWTGVEIPPARVRGNVNELSQSL